RACSRPPLPITRTFMAAPSFFSHLIETRRRSEKGRESALLFDRAFVGDLPPHGHTGGNFPSPRILRVMIDHRLGHTAVRVVIDAIVPAFVAGRSNEVGIAYFAGVIEAAWIRLAAIDGAAA